jgi:hypothetical protein
MTITLPSEVMVWFKSGEKPDSLYGEDVVAAVLDEASRMREEAWYAVRSTLSATRGHVRFIGNVKGRKNWFWKLCRMAESGEPGHTYSKLTWRDSVAGGVMDAAEPEDAKRVLPENVWRELYEAEASDDQGNPFGMDAIRRATGPMSTDNPVAFGWDLAKSVDHTWGIGIDRAGNVCRSIRFQMPWGETVERIIQETGQAAAYLDSTGVGDPIVEQIQRRLPNCRGYKFTQQSKQQLMEGLAIALQQGEIRGLPENLAAECESFEYMYSRSGVHYSAPEGMHDDGVCALALAVSRWRVPGLQVLGVESTPEAIQAEKDAQANAFRKQVEQDGCYFPGG